jgi:hypothetical protein
LSSSGLRSDHRMRSSVLGSWFRMRTQLWTPERKQRSSSHISLFPFSIEKGNKKRKIGGVGGMSIFVQSKRMRFVRSNRIELVHQHQSRYALSVFDEQAASRDGRAKADKVQGPYHWEYH